MKMSNLSSNKVGQIEKERKNERMREREREIENENENENEENKLVKDKRNTIKREIYYRV